MRATTVIFLLASAFALTNADNTCDKAQEVVACAEPLIEQIKSCDPTDANCICGLAEKEIKCYDPCPDFDISDLKNEYSKDCGKDTKGGAAALSRPVGGVLAGVMGVIALL